jgi:hypothetical protein
MDSIFCDSLFNFINENSRGTGSNGTKNGYRHVKKWVLNLNTCLSLILRKRKKGIPAFWVVEQYMKNMN